MKIEIVTMWYNEEFLAPFFLKHYAWADKITLLYDRDSTDNCAEIAMAAPNVEVVPFRFPDMLDEGIKQLRVNEAYERSDADWLALVDADEFLFYKEDGDFRYDLRPLLAASQADVYAVPFMHVYRHKDDADLDLALPAVPQRRHGQLSVGEVSSFKPCVARGGLGLVWKVGCHELAKAPEGLNPVPEVIFCAHWAMADPAFAVTRRVKNRMLRQSKNNLLRQMDVHNQNISGKSVLAEFAAHADDPLLF